MCIRDSCYVVLVYLLLVMIASAVKRKLSLLSLEKRISLMNESKKGRLQRELAILFNCGKTQIQNTLANQDRYVKQWEDNCNKKGRKEGANHLKK